MVDGIRQDGNFWFLRDDEGQERPMMRTPLVDEMINRILSTQPTPIANLPDLPVPVPQPIPTPTPMIPGMEPERRPFLEDVGRGARMAVGLPKTVAKVPLEAGKTAAQYYAEKLEQPAEQFLKGFTGKEIELGKELREGEPGLPKEGEFDVRGPVPGVARGSGVFTDQLDVGFKGLESAFTQRQKAGKELGKAQIEFTQKQAVLQEQALKQAQDQFEADQKERERLNAVLDRDIEEVRSINIDPNRLWNNRGTGQKVMATIGLMLGAVGSAYSRTGRFPAYEMFQGSINQDIAAQEMDINKKMNLLRYNYDRFQDMDAARAATRLQQYTFAQKQIEVMGMKSGSPLIRARVNQANAQIEQDKEAAKVEFTIAMMKHGPKMIDPSNPLSIIQTIPTPQERTAALAELKALAKRKNMYGFIAEKYKHFSDISIGAKIPFTKKKAAFESANAAVVKLLMDKETGVGSQMTVPEFNKAVKPFLLEAFDTEAQTLQKMKGLIEAVEIRMGHPIVLESYGFNVNKFLPTTAESLGFTEKQRVK